MFINRKEKLRLFTLLEKLEIKIDQVFNIDNLDDIAVQLFDYRASVHLDIFITDPNAIVEEDPKGYSVYGKICQYYFDQLQEVEELLFHPSFIYRKDALYGKYRKVVMKRHKLYVKAHMEVNNERLACWIKN